MSNPDVMPCGCYWYKEPVYGATTIKQCAAHKAGAKYEGGTLDEDGAAALVDLLARNGVRAKVFA